MQMMLRPSRATPRSAPARRTRREPIEPPRPDAVEARMRISSAPQDLAHYGCACGYLFTARVATSVTCPHCGAAQAW